MHTIAVSEKIYCSHCGEPCNEETISLKDHHFCCEGCKTVFEIISDHDLDTYYDLEKTPGTQRKKDQKGQLDYLNLEEIQNTILQFRQKNLAGLTLYIPAIHCSSCIWLLENLCRLNPHISQSQVNFVTKEVRIQYNPNQLTLKGLVELLDSLGYMPEISLSPEKKKDTGKNPLVIKIGIAGFCFGNAMLLSLPDYLDHQLQIEPMYRQFFAYLNLLLALPVLLYAASDYYFSAWHHLKKGFLNMDVPITLGILTLFSRSAYEIIAQTGTGYIDSLNGLVFFLLIGKWYQAKTYQALSYERDYQSYFPLAVTRVLDEVEETIMLKEVMPGDRLLIRNGEIIPADAILKDGSAHIDYSFVTGEAIPVRVPVGESLFAGGKQNGSAILVEVSKTVSNSYLTQLWNQEAFVQENRTSIHRLTDKVGRIFTWAVLMIAAGNALYWWWIDPQQIFNTVTAVLIVACPCALALSAPFTFGHALRIFGRKGLYLKNAETVEQMAKVKAVVMDKTGTITQSHTHAPVFMGDPLTHQEKAQIKAITRHSNHPLSQAIYQSLPTTEEAISVDQFEEIAGKGMIAHIDSMTVKIGSAELMGTTGKKSDRQTVVYIKFKEEIRGYFTFRHQYRHGLGRVMEQLKQHYQRHLISGDSPAEKEVLQEYFEELHFRQSPSEKLEYIDQLEQSGQPTMMIGDGLNDAGALKRSSIGVAVVDNIYHFSPACNAILEAAAFERLADFLRFAKSSLHIVYLAFFCSFCYNLVGLGFAVSGILTPLVAAILMPLSSVTVVVLVTLCIQWKAGRIFKT